jgi:E3 ubiquitin-protein ligase HUWE1
LSDNAYTLVAEVVKKLVAIAPTHCQLFVTELAEAVHNLTSSAMAELRVFSEAMKALLSTTSTDGAAILRVLQALSSLVTSLRIMVIELLLLLFQKFGKSIQH